MYSLAKKLLFQIDAETAHAATMKALDALLRGPALTAMKARTTVDTPSLAVNAFGIKFQNPVGLAAGFDKNAEHVEALFGFGFGHIEIGTVTGEGQPGNPKPRLFRLPDDRALLNRMGFNNQGAAAVANRLGQHRPKGILGINLGKTKAVPNDEAHLDYEKSFRLLYDFGDYFVVNVSSPNTPGLRDLQERGPLLALLDHLQELNIELAQQRGINPRPLLLKISPDLTDTAVVEVVEVVEKAGLSGIIATNTTISREGLVSPHLNDLGPGGISGAPVATRRRDVVRLVRKNTKLPIIGVGGIFNASDAIETLSAGADLVQVWTGFVYEGPKIVQRINQGLAAQGFPRPNA